MELKNMYAASVNSRGTSLTEAISSDATDILVDNGSILPEAPNLLVIGIDPSAETVLMTAKNGNTLTVERGLQGSAKAWAAGTFLARNFTAYDHDTFKENIEGINTELGTVQQSMEGINTEIETIKTEMAGVPGQVAEVETKLDNHVGDRNLHKYASGVTQAVSGNAEGTETQATGLHTHAEGYQTLAKGNRSHAEGANTIAEGLAAHAEGQTTKATGTASHSEGYSTTSSGEYAHAEGSSTVASGSSTHAEGRQTQANGDFSHSEGQITKANGNSAHAEGFGSEANGPVTHAEGYHTKAEGTHSHSEGRHSIAGGTIAHAEGHSTYSGGGLAYSINESNISLVLEEETATVNIPTEPYPESLGNATKLYLQFTLAAGLSAPTTSRSYIFGFDITNYNATTGQITFSKPVAGWDPDMMNPTQVNTSKFKLIIATSPVSTGHAEGQSTMALNYTSHAEGLFTEASGPGSHAEGISTYALEQAAHAEGINSIAQGRFSHAQNRDNKALGECSHAEGRENIAEGHNSHAEGYLTHAVGHNSHAEGTRTKAIGNYSHAQGVSTEARASGSHSAGSGTIAIGTYSTALGLNTLSGGVSSVASGHSSIAHFAESLTTLNMMIDTTAKTIRVVDAPYAIPSEGDKMYLVGRSSGSGTPLGDIRELEFVSYDESTKVFTYGGPDPNTVTYSYFALLLPENIAASSSHALGVACSASGVASFAAGYANNAYGNYSAAMGQRCTADNHSISAGYLSRAGGQYSIAMGNGALTQSEMSIAMGVDAMAVEKQTIAIGTSTRAVASYSMALGNQTEANGVVAFATGDASKANGIASIAMGSGSTALNTMSVAIGESCSAGSNNSMTVGLYTLSSGTSSFSLGQYNRSVDNSVLVAGYGSSTSARKNVFRVNNTGTTYGIGSFQTSGADYAEYFEWADKNPEMVDRVGLFVTLEGEKIRPANSTDDYVLGIVSARPALVGDSYDDYWHEKFLKDEWGRDVMEWQEVSKTKFVEKPGHYEEDEFGDEVFVPGSIEKEEVTELEYLPKPNPEYDPDHHYIPREFRTEWATIGLMGKLRIKDDGTCQVNSFCKPTEGGIGTHSDEPTQFRVMRRITENIVEVFMK